MQSHHSLRAWQRAHEVTLGVYRYGATSWQPAFAAAIEQCRRSALSVELNIAEGFASGPGRRCRYHLQVAYASSVETTEILTLLIELNAPGVENLIALRSISRETQSLALPLWKRSIG